MGKYDPLNTYLNACRDPQITLSFTQIEHILGASLPKSARTYHEWWNNEADGSHVQARSWMLTHYRVSKVNMNGSSVTFTRSN